MIIKVQPVNGPAISFLYRINHEVENPVGSIVEVPLRTRTIYALVIERGDHLSHGITYPIREITYQPTLPADPHYYAFIQKVAHHYHIEPTQLFKRLCHFLDKHTEAESPPTIKTTQEIPKIIMLTQEQQHAYDLIAPAITQQKYIPTLVHGVTGSGKTEVYKKLMLHAHACHKTVIFMVPEVSLACRFTQLFHHTLPSEIPIFDFHSASTPNSKKLLWQALINKKALIIIGVHQPILLPVNNLGLIIVDEEHETGYQEKKHPKINSKEAALLRAQQAHIPIVLGSATPSISSLYTKEQKNWQFAQLTTRYRGNFPTIQIVYLTDKSKKRRNFWITHELDTAIADRLARKEQIILFINRRGHSFFAQCKQCAHVFMCRHCAVSLTPHSNNTLQCHYCGYQIVQPPECPQCKQATIITKGIGTQQVVSILEKLYPAARIARADLDTTRKKKLWQQTLTDFTNGELDILVGTQTITKGYHFRNVTLVGILWADLQINIPQFNAAEKVLQQLLQVAGRAGREQENSLVIVQAMAEHALFSTLNEINYLDFYRDELERRRILSYPPCGRFCTLELIHKHEATVAQDAFLVASCIKQLQPTVTILGPTTPPVAKIKNYHYRVLYLKSSTFAAIDQAYVRAKQLKLKSSLYFSPT